MISRDWSLVFFTTLSQWSIGIVLCFTGLELYPGDSVLAAATGLGPANPFFLALLLIATATIVSFLHLGKPVNAPRALRNLATSWLSREILAIGLFSLALLVVFVHGWKTGDGSYPGYLLIPASVAGLFLLWTMSRVYILPTVPAWNSGHTPLGFTTTALCLGLATYLAFSAAGYIGIDEKTHDFCAMALAVILAVEWVSGLLQQRRLVKMDTGPGGPTFDHGALHFLFLVRTALLLIACLGITIFTLQTSHPPGPDHLYWLYPALALAIVQEFAGRFLFYASYFRLGL